MSPARAHLTYVGTGVGGWQLFAVAVPKLGNGLPMQLGFALVWYY
jgi:hypothetical protein